MNLLIAAAAAWTLCFGHATVTCEAYQQVYSCNQYGCNVYGTTPLDPSKKYHGNALRGEQLIPDGHGVLVPVCLYDSCEYWDSHLPTPMPQTDFRPVTQ